jgi:hypothetical protein
VKFQVDNQLPAALAQYIRGRGLDSQHVLDLGLLRGSVASEASLGSAGKLPHSGSDQRFDSVWPKVEARFRAGELIVELR